MTMVPVKLWLDSIDMVEHDQANPSEWDVSLERVIHDVTSVSILQLHVPTSPYIIVIRTSKWYDTAQTNFDSFHDKVLLLETEFQSKSNNAVVIYVDDGTASLNVHKVYTVTETGAAADFRTFDCFLCTGTNNNTGTGTWYVSDQDDTSSPFSFATDDGTYGTPAAAGEITISAAVQPVDYFLKLKINGSPVNATDSWSASHIAQRWRSYQWYRPGEIVSVADTIVRYECVKDHTSVVFAGDLTSALWRALPTDGTVVGGGRRPAEGALVALTFSDDNESTLIQRTSANTYKMVYKTPVSVSQIGVSWVDSTGNEVLFPIETRLDVRNLDTGVTPMAYSRGHAKSYKMMLEFA
jgi:hypothetical protein